MPGFMDWLHRNENYGGSTGDPSGAGLNQPETGERQVSAEPNSALDGSDRPITAKNRSQKIVGRMGGIAFSKKKCNCK